MTKGQSGSRASASEFFMIWKGLWYTEVHSIFSALIHPLKLCVQPKDYEEKNISLFTIFSRDILVFV